MVDVAPTALWGGVECSVVRIGDTFRNQIEETGHHGRAEDLAAIAALGIRTLRYPVLWETIAPDDPGTCDWTWTDDRLAQLRDLGIEPIAGLVHHGSGPRYTNLLDPAFPDLLARHAAQTAERYPWLRMVTPINEPLTTARFSGLYGHWYPHGRDYPTFLRALVTQCRAIVLAMRAMRRVIPDLKLVQTEDVGKVFSTPALRYQADHENERRWLSFDLLTGQVDRHHPWRRILLDNGISEGELALFSDGEGTPDIVGVNHYPTSDRYLDTRLHRYPADTHGGNGRQAYADVAALRIDLPACELGFKARLTEVWERYRLPMAVTEAHLGCTREEQVRWLVDVWCSVEALKAEGQDIRAVTVWSLFGAVDWNSLLVERHGDYEPGAFDVRSGTPRLTALAQAAQSLATTGTFAHALLDGAGWWQRDGRLLQEPRRLPSPQPLPARPVLITGATGTLGHALSRVCAARGLAHVALRRVEMDITDAGSVATAIDRHRPWAVINAAGFVRVAEAERVEAECRLANAEGAAIVAAACAARDVPLVAFSSDLVFDGRLGRPYVESDQIAPTSAYGRSKAEAERRIAEAHPAALIVRTAAFFGPWDRANFAYHILRNLAQGRTVAPGFDVVSPTYVPDLAHATLDLLLDGERGVWHLSNGEAVSWAAFAERLAAAAGLSWSAPLSREPVCSTALASERGVFLPPLDDAIARFVRECDVDWRGEAFLDAAE
ncbi:MAG: family 1 glycosylhydrolase [Hyphomicrobiales bacterium]